MLAVALAVVLAVVAVAGLAGLLAMVARRPLVAHRAFVRLALRVRVIGDRVLGLAMVGVCAPEVGVQGDRSRPAVVGRHKTLLQPMELRRTRLDAHALGQRAPTLATVALPVVGHVAARPSDDLGDGAGVIHVARRPAAVDQQVSDQVARGAVVAHHLVDEGIAVARAVAIHIRQLGVDPDVAAARIPADCLRMDGKGSGRQHSGQGKGLQEAVQLLHAVLDETWTTQGVWTQACDSRVNSP